MEEQETSRFPSVCVHVKLLQSCLTLWLLCLDSPLDSPGNNTEMGFPFPSPRNHPEPGIKPMPPVSPALQADSLPLSHWGGPSFCVADAYTSITMSGGSLSTVFTGNETRIRKETTISS